MISATAERLRLKREGLLEGNYDADITVFDLDRIIDNGTYENPKQFPSGIHWVLVNGVIVFQEGRHSGARPGRTVRTR